MSFKWREKNKTQWHTWEDFDELLEIINTCDGKVVDPDWLNDEIAVVGELSLSRRFIDIYLSKEIVENPNNSSLAFYLGITKGQPVSYPDGMAASQARNSFPDIDLDMQDSMREAVMDRTRDKYGAERTAQIVTFGEIGAKKAVRDVCRVLDRPYDLGDRLSKAMPPAVFGIAPSLKKCMEHPEFRMLYDSDEEAKEIVDTAFGIEGLWRNTGIHAAGFLIADDDITNYVPIMQAGEGKPVATQWDMSWTEKCGLLKVDFLGLKNLSIVSKCIENVKETQDIDIGNPYELLSGDLDPGVFHALSAGENLGVFQMEGGGFRDLMMDLKPSTLNDISAMLALYRPGPMGSNVHKEYAARKNGLKPVKYLHPLLKPILKDTYGLLLYQEQLLEITKSVAGKDAFEADEFRSIVGKKKLDKMAGQRDSFIDGCVNFGGLRRADAEQLFNEIEHHAAYSFNKSHCLTGETLLRGGNGTLISIHEIIPEIHADRDVAIYSYDTDTGEYFVNNCIDYVYEGSQDVFEIEFQDGSKIKATMGHKFLCEFDLEYRTLTEIVASGFKIVTISDRGKERHPHKIKTLMPKGEQHVYSLCMEAPHHNYVLANGLVSKNSVSYGFLSYITTYLRINYPIEYMAACLSSSADKEDKMRLYLNGCRSMGITVDRPSLKHSGHDFTIKGDKILYGLDGIAGFGDSITDSIISGRNEEDPYKNIFDLMRRGNADILNKKILLTLIKSGGLDEILVLSEYESEMLHRDKIDLLFYEGLQLGVFLGDHPFAELEYLVYGKVSHTIDEAYNCPTGTPVTVAGVVTAVEKKTTRAKQRMFILDIEDDGRSIEVVVFSRFAETLSESPFKKGDLIVMSGKVKSAFMADESEGAPEVTLTMEAVEVIDYSEDSNILPPIYLRSEKELDSYRLEKMVGIIDNANGSSPVFLELKIEGGKKVVIKFNKTTSLSSKEVLQQLIEV